MSHTDRINYLALRTIDVRARDDHDAYLALHKEIDASEYDHSHVAQALASILVPLLQKSPTFRQDLDRMLEQTKLFAAADIPDDEEIFLPKK